MAELKYNMASRVIDSQRFEKKVVFLSSRIWFFLEIKTLEYEGTRFLRNFANRLPMTQCYVTEHQNHYSHCCGKLKTCVTVLRNSTENTVQGQASLHSQETCRLLARDINNGIYTAENIFFSDPQQDSVICVTTHVCVCVWCVYVILHVETKFEFITVSAVQELACFIRKHSRHRKVKRSYRKHKYWNVRQLQIRSLQKMNP
jgi:hypothetical protein